MFIIIIAFLLMFHILSIYSYYVRIWVSILFYILELRPREARPKILVYLYISRFLEAGALGDNAGPLSVQCLLEGPQACFFAPWVSSSRFSNRFQWLFVGFRSFEGPENPPGHEKTMKIIVLSPKIKVSSLSSKYGIGFAFVTLGLHFGDYFGRLWAPWDWASKALPKNEKLRSSIAMGALSVHKDANGAPGPPKWTPKLKQ